ncbi:MAG TPA: hypothetical protein VFF65_04110 [Phycisphaerales bacterium]|nr:hypothetical protein [Phycisphaerales bacterium]
MAAIVAALRSSDLDDQLSQLYVQIRAAEAARAAEDAEPEAAQMLADAPTLEQLRAQRTAIITAARQLARQQLGAAEAAALGNWWAAPPFLPAEMRVRSWTTAEVGPVYGALAAERRCAQRGEAMPADSLVLLANLRAEGAVVTASSNLLINAAAARNALNSARSNPN